jgi:hypothetical protein
MVARPLRFVKLLGKLCVMPSKANPPGPTGQRVAANIKARRHELFGRRSKVEMGRRLTALGRPMSIDVLTKIETGTRIADADDLVALALVLEVSPNRLMFEDLTATDKPEQIELTSTRAMPYPDAQRWAYDGRVNQNPEQTIKNLAELAMAALSKDAPPGQGIAITYHPEDGIQWINRKEDTDER